MSSLELVRRRFDGSYDVDEWGLDPDLVAMVSPVFGARWRITVDGAGHVPEKGPVVLVHSRRFSLSEPFVLSRGIRLSTERWVRPLGMPDVAPIGPVLRRFGAVPAGVDELASLLRAGHVAALALSRELRHRHRAGRLHPEILGPALELEAPVVPVAVVGREAGRRWRIIVGPAVSQPPGRGPLAVAELGDRARAAVQALLDEALPPRWAF